MTQVGALLPRAPRSNATHTARLLTWLISTDRETVTTRIAYDRIEEHGCAEPYGALVDLEARGILQAIPDQFGEGATGVVYRLPYQVRGTTGLQVKAELWLQAMAEKVSIPPGTDPSE